MNTKKSKHTPGPWRAVKRGADCDFIINIVAKGNPRAIANAIDAGTNEQVNHYKKENEEQAANAALISAAPDLLNCLDVNEKYSVSAILREHGYNYEADRIDAAVKKAMGGN